MAEPERPLAPQNAAPGYRRTLSTPYSVAVPTALPPLPFPPDQIHRSRSQSSMSAPRPTPSGSRHNSSTLVPILGAGIVQSRSDIRDEDIFRREPLDFSSADHTAASSLSALSSRQSHKRPPSNDLPEDRSAAGGPFRRPLPPTENSTEEVGRPYSSQRSSLVRTSSRSSDLLVLGTDGTWAPVQPSGNLPRSGSFEQRITADLLSSPTHSAVGSVEGTGSNFPREHGSSSDSSRLSLQQALSSVQPTIPQNLDPRRLPDAIRSMVENAPQHPRRDSSIRNRHTFANEAPRRPPWQPDADVIDCPICKSGFGFFNRRHHCRKCGRVVCGDCANHFVPIPRAFVVQDPSKRQSTGPGWPREQSRRPSITFSGDARPQVASPVVPSPLSPVLSDDEPESGEPVRVCDDCLAISESNVASPVGSISGPSGSGVDVPHVGGRRRRQSSQGGRSVPFQPYPYVGTASELGYPQGPPPPPPRRGPGEYHYSHVVGHGQPPQYSPHPARYGSAPAGNRYYPTPSLPPQQLEALFQHPIPQPPVEQPPPPQYKEEDLCPICQRPLPSLGPSRNEALNEAHIVDCITSHEHPSSPSRNLSGISTPDIVSSSGSSPRGRPRRESRVVGSNAAMVVYKAVEADTVEMMGDDEGAGSSTNEKRATRPAECIICFCEFEVGETIARLQCLCRYHKKCITDWFDRKKSRDCPIHAFNAGDWNA